MAHVDELCSVSCRGKRLIKHTRVFAHRRRRGSLELCTPEGGEGNNGRTDADTWWDIGGNEWHDITIIGWENERGMETRRHWKWDGSVSGSLNASREIGKYARARAQTVIDWPAPGLVSIISGLGFAIRLRWRASQLIIEFARNDSARLANQKIVEWKGETSENYSNARRAFEIGCDVGIYYFVVINAVVIIISTDKRADFKGSFTFTMNIAQINHNERRKAPFFQSEAESGSSNNSHISILKQNVLIKSFILFFLLCNTLYRSKGLSVPLHTISNI